MNSIAVILFVFLLWRAVWPLDCKLWLKILAGLTVLVISFKFKVIKILGGNYFAPDLPGWFLLLAAAAYITAFLFIFFLIIADTFLWGMKLGKNFRTWRENGKFDWKKLFEKHKAVNKVHAWGLLGVFLLAIAGIYCGLATPQIRKIEFVSPKISPAASGIKIAVLSDLHVDNLNDRERIRKIVDQTNALKADIVCMLGDFSDGVQKQHLEALSELAKLRSKYGVFSVPGNHEYYCGYKILMDHFKKIGLPILYNESVFLEKLNLSICGITDRQARKTGDLLPDIPKALALAPKESFKIMLAHRPKTAHQSAKYGADIQFSGHTHGGMVWGFDRLVASGNGGFAWGTHNVGKMTLILSNGTCMWSGFPVRLGHPAEILLVTLKARDK